MDAVTHIPIQYTHHTLCDVMLPHLRIPYEGNFLEQFGLWACPWGTVLIAN